MKLVVSGSRSIKNAYAVHKALDDYDKTSRIDVLISGGAKGVDMAAEAWAVDHGIMLKKFLPSYGLYGKIAPLIRNSKMATYGDALLAIWDMKSKGTLHMINAMKKLDKPVTIISVVKE